ncbi:MAG TPA: hypothetical protein VF060_27385 [Trebonia sp.]
MRHDGMHRRYAAHNGAGVAPADPAPDAGDGAEVIASEPAKGNPAPRIPSRKVLLVMLGLTAVVVAFFSSYSSSLGKPSPHRIPVAVTAPPAVVDRLSGSPMLKVQPVADLAKGRVLVEDRTAYGALALPSTGPATLLVASGGGHAIAALLTQLGQQEAIAHGTVLRTVDIAPTSPYDPNGTVEFYCVIFLGIGGAVGASVLGRLLGPVRRPRDVLTRLGLAVPYAAFLSAVVTLFADVVYGALVGHFALLFLTLWLFVTAVCLAVLGVAALAGIPASALLIVVFILFGNTSCGGAVPRPLLNGLYAAVNPVLPHGAAVSALRGVQYFGDRGNGEALLCLAIWAVAGLALMGIAGLRGMRNRVSPDPEFAVAGRGSRRRLFLAVD